MSSLQLNGCRIVTSLNVIRGCSRLGVASHAGLCRRNFAAIIGAMRTLQEMDGHGGVAALGDWHGNTHYAVRVIRHLASRGMRRFVHTGDFAYDFRPGFCVPWRLS